MIICTISFIYHWFVMILSEIESYGNWIFLPIVAKSMHIIPLQLNLLPLYQFLLLSGHILHNLLEFSKWLLFQLCLEVVFFDQIISPIWFFSWFGVHSRLSSSVENSFIPRECFGCARPIFEVIAESACQSFLNHMLQDELRHFCFVDVFDLMSWTLLLQFLYNPLMQTFVNQCYFIRHPIFYLYNV